MVRVQATGDEPIEVLIRKFNKKVQAAGLLTELKKREFYEKPSLAKKRDLAARRRKVGKRGVE